VTQIKDDLTMEQLQTVMSYVKQGESTYADVVETVHTAPRRPENVFYRDIGHGRRMWARRASGKELFGRFAAR